jgi:ABC-type polysaccharide/polyol phosphate transport system ATPase subunit
MRIARIPKFVDIGEYTCHPVKTYSSGMNMQLAFSFAINIDPDIPFNHVKHLKFEHN